MAKYQITGPDGSKYEVTAPDTASDADVMQVFQSQMAQPQPNNVSAIESIGRGALQGATFGFGDEIYAGARGLGSAVTGGSFNDTYNRELAGVRAANKKAQSANPWAYMGGEIAGGLALPFGALKTGATVARAATTGGRFVQGAKTGGALGAAYGLGTAEGGEGSIAQQAGQRALSALPQAAAGAVIGGAAPYAVDFVANTAKSLATPFRAHMRPREFAQQKVAEALVRDSPEAPTNLSALQAAEQKLAGYQAQKPDTILADVGGQNTRDLLRSATNLPSEGAERLRRTLNTRQKNQWSRIEDDLSKTLANGDLFGHTLNDITQRLKATGQTEFKAAYDFPLSQQAADEIGQFIGTRGYMEKILKKTSDSVSGMTGQKLDQLKPYEILHRAKMEIDKQIGRLMRGQGDPADNWTVGDLIQLKREFVGLLGKNNKQFATALQKYGDEASLRTALERGADEFKKLSPGELQVAMSGMTEPERRLFRLGAARSMFTDIEKGHVNYDRVKRMFSSPEMAKKLRSIYPDEARLKQFKRALAIESRMATTRAAVQGNSTTARQLAQGFEAGQGIEAANATANALVGRFRPVFDFLARGVQRASGLTPEVSNEIIGQLMQKSGLTTNKAMQAALERASREPAYRAQLAQRLTRAYVAGQSALPSQ